MSPTRQAYQLVNHQSPGDQHDDQSHRLQPAVPPAPSAVRRCCPRVGPLVTDGGLELFEAAARHGDDVIAIAGKVGPATRRTLALEADRLVPLARRYGPEILDLEAEAPCLARRVAESFGPDMVGPLARNAAASDLPRLLAAAERATSPAARELLWMRCLEGGSQFLKWIDWRVVLATGLSVAVIDAAHRVTAPLAAAGETIRKNPEAAKQLGGSMIWWPSVLWSATPLLIAACLLWRFGLMPWHRRDPRQQVGGSPAEQACGATNQKLFSGWLSQSFSHLRR